MTMASLLGILVFVIGVPAVAACLFAFPHKRRLFLSVMVFSICYVKKPLYQEVFFVNYRGVDRGFAVTVPDLLFFGFLAWMMAGGLREKIRWLPFNSIPWFLLIIVSGFSLIGSIEPLYGLFTIHKFIRCWILYLVIVNLVRDRADVMAVLTALAACVVFEGCNVLWAKYITKEVVARSLGTFRHPNTLAMFTDLILPLLMGSLMAGALIRKQRILFSAALLLGFVAVLFTKSRAAMILLPMSLGTVALISVAMRPTGRKFGILLIGVAAIGIITLLALPRLIKRFESAPKESAETRGYFNDAAKAMANENLFGVGINLFSHSLAESDYYWYVYPDKTEVDDPEAFRETTQGQSRLGTAHHIYWLYAAETGYPGLLAFLLHTGLFSAYNLIYFLREKDHLFKSILLGMLVGTTIHHLHGVLEWIFRQTEVQYLYFVLMGTMVAMVAIRRREMAGPPSSRGKLSRPLKRVSIVPKPVMADRPSATGVPL